MTFWWSTTESADLLLTYTRHQRINAPRHNLFNVRSKRRRLTVCDHCPASFIAALFEHSPGRYIGKHVVRITSNPQRVKSILAFETKRIVHNDFPAQSDKRHILAELPHLNWIRMMVGQLAVTIENLQHQAGVPLNKGVFRVRAAVQ